MKKILNFLINPLVIMFGLTVLGMTITSLCFEQAGLKLIGLVGIPIGFLISYLINKAKKGK